MSDFMAVNPFAFDIPTFVDRAAIFYIQSSVILVAALIMTRILSKRGPAAQALVCRIGLLTMVCSGFILFRFGGLQTGLVHVPTRRMVESSASSIQGLIAKSNAPKIEAQKTTKAVVSAPNTVSAPVSNYVNGYAIVFGIWLSGAILSLMWLAYRIYRVKIFRDQCKNLTEDATEDLEMVSSDLGLKKPQLLSCRETSSPILMGYFQPAIVLPHDYQSAFNTPEFRSILVHELTHLVRKDCWWNLFGKVAGAVCWPQFLLPIVLKRLEQSAEEVCDLAVLEQNIVPSVYAGCLVRLAERLRPQSRIQSMGNGAVGFHSSLGKRVQIIMSPDRVQNIHLNVKTKLVIGVCAALTMIAGLIVFDAGAGANSKSPLAAAKRVQQGDPKTTVTSIVTAINSSDLKQIVPMVVGGRTHASLDAWMSMAKTSPLKAKIISISSVETGNTATVKVEAEFVNAGKTELSKETLSLVRNGENWMVEPPKEIDMSNNKDVRYLTAITYFIGHPEKLAFARNAATATACLSNIKQIGLGLLMFVQDYNEVYKLKASEFKAKVMPYIKNEAVFNCPELKEKGTSYSFNSNLQGIKLANVKSPAETVAVYEGTGNKLTFRHDGKAAVCYVDGHAKLVDKAAAAKLVWVP